MPPKLLLISRITLRDIKAPGTNPHKKGTVTAEPLLLVHPQGQSTLMLFVLCKKHGVRQFRQRKKKQSGDIMPPKLLLISRRTLRDIKAP